MKYREEKAREEQKKLILLFSEGNAFPPAIRKEIYKQLSEKFRIDCSQSILIRWIPEGADVISGSLISQEGEICYLDIDGKDPSNSEVDRFKVNTFLKDHKYKQLKPWDELKIAIDIYKQKTIKGGAIKNNHDTHV